MNKELEEQFLGTILGANKLRQKLRRVMIQYTQFTELTAHTRVGWDETTNTKNSSFKAFQAKGCKHYNSLKELFRSKIATGALHISSTDPPKSPETYARMEEKEPINPEEGSGDSDDSVHEVTELVVTRSRRRVCKRSSTTGSRLQECLDMLKCNLNSRNKERNYTPLESKRSKSVTNPKKPAKGSIEEAMDVLNKPHPSMSIQEYLVASDRLSKEEHTRHMFMCFLDDTRLRWVRSLLGP
ncbi:hypothetical protein CDL15_Pgr016558 [Punica granatum]|uniref:Myb/SANT-like domain-containing protein n=1 Tax=Punica granatum TaxID=22663 RepID=A0A218WJV1_PUNGR|nr:hypothetical protein CDL15_Pgr016558 [Punica granatum]PKI77736.1 hypothetical protein CRG98_001860 [Punica granatum]